MTGNTPEDFAKRYDEMSDDALLELAGGSDELVPEAEAALEAELARRGLEISSPVTNVTEHRDLVVVTRFRDLNEAQLAQGALEAAGIESVLRDDNMVRLDWFVSNAIGGIRLEVDRENAEVATDLLNHESTETFEGDIEGTIAEACPKCQSTKVAFQQEMKATRFLSIPMPETKHFWRCAQCGNEWEEE